MAIKLIVDSASDFSEAEAQEHGIIMLPMNISFEDKDYLDGVDILPEQFYPLLAASSTIPTTSLINSFRFGEAFAQHTQNGDQVIVITISSKLSGTYQAAVQASLDYPNQVYVIDSLNACTGEKILCLYAMQLISSGLSATEIVDRLNTAKTRIRLVAIIDTLEYLKKGGRISAMTAVAGKILTLKPIISVIDGEVRVITKSIGFKNSCNQLTKMIDNLGGINTNMPFGLIWSGVDCQNLDTFINNHPQLSLLPNLPKYNLGCTIGTHIGPGAVGVAFFEGNN